MRTVLTLLGVILVGAMGSNATLAQGRLAFDFGVRAGVPTRTFLESDFNGIQGLATVQQTFERPSFTAGPTFAVALYDRVLVQFDALYKPIRFLTNQTTPTAVITGNSRGGSWEFPIVFDYRFGHGKVRPYLGGGGLAGQIISGTTESVLTVSTTGRTDQLFSQFGSADNQFPAYIGNAGVEWSASHFVVRPELRYTRWDQAFGSPKRRRDQVEFLVGFSFR